MCIAKKKWQEKKVPKYKISFLLLDGCGLKVKFEENEGTSTSVLATF